MAANMTWIEDIREWTDGIGGEWRDPLDNVIDDSASIRTGAEPLKTQPAVYSYLRHKFSGSAITDISNILSEMRMIKRPEEMALETIRPGVSAEDVHYASLEVYQSEGFGICYRTGRGVGYSYPERPEFKGGDQTVLQAGMTFAVDGGITIKGEFGARVGDSVVVTDDGFEYLAPYPKQLQVL